MNQPNDPKRAARDREYAQRYDQLQTQACNALRERLQSIAAQAVQAQELDPSGDKLMDLLGDISQDLCVAQWLNQDLNSDDVERAARTAERGTR